MNDPGPRLARFFQELKRRRVLRVAAVYAVAGWAVVEVADTVAPLLLLPDWTSTLVVVLVLLGFPLVMAVTWTFDVAPEGLRRTEPADEAAVVPAPTGHAAVGSGNTPERPWTAGRIAVVGAVAVLAVAGLAMLTVSGEAPLATIENRVAVLPFENRTGDAELNEVGIVTAELIADGLTAIDEAQSVSATEVRQMLARAEDADSLRWIAMQTRAGLAVTGSYLLIGDTVQIRAQLVDPLDGTALVSFEPVRSHRSDPTRAVGSIRQRVMGAVATRLNTASREFWTQFPEPPPYQAYRTFLVGVELFNSRRYSESIPAFDRAREVDSTFWQPAFWTATAFGNMGQPALRDSVIRLLEPHRSEMPPVERLWLDWHRAQRRGDLAAGYHAVRRANERGPNSVSRYIAALYALRTNRPAEAVALLQQEPPAAAYRTVWYAFHSVLTDALHILGDHERELEAAREARELFAGHPGPVYLEARALIALDRTDEAVALVDEIFTLTSTGSAAIWTRRLGDVLAANGYTDDARRLYDRALTALQAESPPDSPAWQRARAEVLQRVGRLDEAASLAAAAHAADPDDRQAHALAGIIAARRGDRERAERVAAELAARDDPYGRGANTYSRACIRSLLGDLNRAVELLRQAHAEGQPLGYWIRIDPDLRPLHGHPGFDELVRPEG